jgi:hypothetical protein
MKMKKTVLLVICAVVLTGCGSAGETAAPIPTVTVTVTQPAVTVTAAPPQATNGASLLAVGEVGATPAGGSVTVYEHRKNVEPQDANQEAIDVQVCVGAKPSGSDAADYPIISVSPWALYDGQNRRYASASTTWQHQGAQPGYPVEQRVTWGDCVRGWVIIEGQSATTMTKVRYTAGSVILEWKLAA